MSFLFHPFGDKIFSFCQLKETILFLYVLYQQQKYLPYFPVTLSRETFVCSDNFVAFYNEIKPGRH